jgi:carbamoyltransferase
MKILGLSCYYHDAAACLIIDDKIVAAGAEERFSRVKHDNRFPKLAVEYCLNEAKIAANEIDVIVFYEKPIVKFDRVLHQQLQHFPRNYRTYNESFGSWISTKLKLPDILKKELNYHGKVLYLEHHLAHAASSFYLSGYDDATIVTLDGVGEWATTTIGYGKGKDISIDRELHFPHSLGLLYSAMTAYLGFSVNDAEYKVMGLAAYGDPKPFAAQMDQLITVHDDGSYSLNMKYFDFEWSDRMYSQKLEQLFGYPTRQSESPMERHYENIAAALQAKLEEVVFKILNIEYRKKPNPNLCLAGGVALNSVMNGKLLSKTPYKNLFIPPDPGDAGGAMGAALYIRFHPELLGEKTLVGPKIKKTKKLFADQFNPYLGPSYTWYEITSALEKYELEYEFFADKKKLVNHVAELIGDQQIIGWFQGRMEWGPRALGARSILASAATVEMRDIINEKVKHRELFRPFAPVILEKYTDKYFYSDKKLPKSARYMLMVYPFKPKIGQRDVPAVVHVDGTGRLQTLHRDDNQMYYDVIDQHRKKTGVPIIINTSFNIRGEPIVCTPKDAINCFLHTDIDVLILDQFVVRKVKPKALKKATKSTSKLKNKAKKSRRKHV